MPELPEVETVRRGLEQVLGMTVAGATVLHPRAVRRQPGGAADFTDRLADRRLTTVRRRGKYLWFGLDSGEALSAHLGMSGQFRIGGGDGAGPHDRVLLRFRAGPTLRFVDQRTFGGMAVEAVDSAGRPVSIAHIAADPFEPEFDRSATVARIRRSGSGIKRVLLDQSVVSGIGNIYADEALWRARLHFERPAGALSVGEVSELLDAATAVMADALTAGGTSFDALYVDVNGDSGWFDRSLAAYGQEGKPCPRCGEAIRRTRFTNRSSFYCPRCQRPS